MDSERSGNHFDRFAKALAAGTDRRAALRALAAGAGAALLARFGAGPAWAGDEAAEPELFGGDCRLNGQPCRFDRQCCTRNCVDFACRCRNEGIRCRSSAQCCSELCEKGICRCRGRGETCSSDAQCCGDAEPTPERRSRPRGINGDPRRLTCEQGICTCRDFGDPCETNTDCCPGLFCFIFNSGLGFCNSPI